MAIRVELDELRHQADMFGTKSEEQLHLKQECDSLVGELENMWTGAASEAFAQQWHELQPALESAAQLLEDIKMQLHSVADTMEDTDASLANSMK